MGLSLDRFRNEYFFREHDSDFARGRRSEWVYALPSRRISYTYLNPDGPEPWAYLEYARRDIEDGTQQGAINALGHAKRAIHQVVDKLLETYCLTEWVGSRAPFPVRAELLRDLGALPTRMVSQLNRERNAMEHDYTFVEVDRVEDFVELAELFLLVAYPFFRGGVIGAYVGTTDGECLNCFIDLHSTSLCICNVTKCSHEDFPFGRVHYNMEQPDQEEPANEIPIDHHHQSEWMKFLDLFIYCTRRATVRLPVDETHKNQIYHRRSSFQILVSEDDRNEMD